ncbi:DUF2283 domain-containing protein [Spirulina sp. 06S082]|uniref:DUF2283 domain-containing protein n=1 Tax=Spirulina sp. 06S082 TaxID=3110248 RepID=UPI002B211F93|nr:DUF2283 domain-containing protein [Spirulina sp. 06S082]MEA5467348.1 DUF2283 domain-containing protein [Spirulina sp. 06S082]
MTEKTIIGETNYMDNIKILEDSDKITGFYDKEADVLYLSLGDPAEAVAVEIEDGVLARYNEEGDRVVGITLIGLRKRIQQELNHHLKVLPHEEGWGVIERNEELPARIFTDRESALKYALGIAKVQWCEVVIYSQDNQIEQVLNPTIDKIIKKRVNGIKSLEFSTH